jgi:ubiquitin C-terminal hydrolase
MRLWEKLYCIIRLGGIVLMAKKIIVSLLLSVSLSVVVGDVALTRGRPNKTTTEKPHEPVTAGKRKRTPPPPIDLTGDDSDDDIQIVEPTEGTKKLRPLQTVSTTGIVSGTHVSQPPAAAKAPVIDLTTGGVNQQPAPGSGWGQRLRAVASWLTRGYIAPPVQVAVKPSAPAASAYVEVPLSVPTVPTIGFENLGNTCFINSAVQALLHTPRIMNYALPKLMPTKKLVNTVPNLYRVFNGLARDANAALHGEVKHTIIPQNGFAARVRNQFLNEGYNDFGQQWDVTEVLLPFFDRLPIDDGLKIIVNHQQRTTVQCNTCKKRFVKSSVETSLLQIPVLKDEAGNASSNLEDCLAAYQSGCETKDYECGHCNKHLAPLQAAKDRLGAQLQKMERDKRPYQTTLAKLAKARAAYDKARILTTAFESVEIRQTGDVFMVELRRHLEPAVAATGNPGVKDMSAVPFNQTLDIHAKRYVLTAVICHRGASLGGGHYIALVRHMSHGAALADAEHTTWLLCDDSAVGDCTAKMGGWMTSGVVVCHGEFQPQVFVYQRVAAE